MGLLSTTKAKWDMFWGVHFRCLWGFHSCCGLEPSNPLSLHQGLHAGFPQHPQHRCDEPWIPHFLQIGGSPNARWAADHFCGRPCRGVASWQCGQRGGDLLGVYCAALWWHARIRVVLTGACALLCVRVPACMWVLTNVNLCACVYMLTNCKLRGKVGSFAIMTHYEQITDHKLGICFNLDTLNLNSSLWFVHMEPNASHSHVFIILLQLARCMTTCTTI